MPIYEYVCVDCEQEFEKIVDREESVRCPTCNGERLEKQYSRFGLGKSVSSSYPSLPIYNSGGGCCGGGCACNCKN